jgi:tetratricopeptide (TPR) repeat protein
VTAALENLADSPAVRLDYHLSRGDFAAARQLLETAAVDPFTAQLMAGKIRLAEGQLYEAAAALEAARQLDPRQADPYLYLSQIALARPQLVEARALAEAALYLRRDAETLYQPGW